MKTVTQNTLNVNYKQAIKTTDNNQMHDLLCLNTAFSNFYVHKKMLS